MRVGPRQCRQVRLCLVLLLAPVLLPAPAARAQQWVFQVFNTLPSLVDSRINDVAQDTDGAIWAATWGGGVAVIHKASVRAYTTRDGLPSDWTYRVAADGEGGVWVASPDGLSHIHAGVVTAYLPENTPTLPTHAMRSVRLFPDGRMWVGTRDGHILTLDPRAPENGFTQLAGPEMTGGAEVHDLWPLPNGGAYAATSVRGVLHFDGTHWRPVGGAGAPTAADRLLMTTDGLLHVVSFQGHLHTYTGISWERLQGPGPPVRTLANGPFDTLYAGTDVGLYRRDNEATWTLMDLGRRVGQPRIATVLFSRDASLWLASYEGLVHGGQPLWQRVPAAPGGHALEGSSLLVAPGEPPLIADVTGRLLRFEAEAQAWQPAARFDDPQFRPFALAARGDKRYWALANQALFQISLDPPAILEKHPIQSELQAHRLFLTHEGEPWLLSYTGNYALREGGFQLVPSDPEYSGGPVEGVAQAPDGVIYVAEEFKAYRLRGDLVEPLDQEFPILDGLHFLDVTVRENGEVWLATSGAGVIALDGAEMRQYTMENGLRSDRTERLFEAADGTMWVATRRRGLSSLRDGLWLDFTILDGLPNTAPLRIAEYPRNTLWIAGPGEVVMRYVPRNEAPEAFILASPQEIGHRRSGMFFFGGRASWNVTPEEGLLFSWRFVPERELDTESGWSPFTATTYAVQNPVRPGRHIFQVRAMDKDRSIDSDPASVVVNVLPPFWLTPLFVLPMALLALITGILLVAWYRMRLARTWAERQLRRQAQSLAKAQEIARVGNWEWDVETDEVVWSKEVCRIFGLDPAQEGYTREDFWNAVPEDERAEVRQHTIRVLKHRVPPDFSHRVRRPDGEIRHVHELGEIEVNPEGRVVRIFGTITDITERTQSEQERERLITELRAAVADVRTLSGLLPICAQCKNIRDDKGYWQQIEGYIRAHSDAEFSHSICPECMEALYGEHLREP